MRLRLSVRPGHYLSGESDALRFTLPHDPREFPDLSRAMPKKTSDVLVISRSEMRTHLYALLRLFADDDPPAQVRLHVCDDGVRVSARHPKTGERVELALKDYATYGRPFVRQFNLKYLIDAFDHLPSASHDSIACNAEVWETPIVLLPWLGHGGRTATKTRVLEHVGLGLKVATFALVMPLRKDKEDEDGCAR